MTERLLQDSHKTVHKKIREGAYDSNVELLSLKEKQRFHVKTRRQLCQDVIPRRRTYFVR